MKVAIVQYTVEDDIVENFNKVKLLLTAAVEGNPEYIFLPECFIFISSDINKTKNNALTIGSHYINFFKNFSLINKVNILLGSLTIKNGKSFSNTSLLINSSGAIVSSYDKIHLFDVNLKKGESYKESDTYSHGNKLVLFKSDELTLGHTICYDLRFPKLYRQLSKIGANLIVVPSAFTETTGKDHWHVLLRARAIENGIFIIAPNQWGINRNNRHTYGHSLVIDPWGHVLGDAGKGEKILFCDIDLSEVKKIQSSIPSLTHDKNFDTNGKDLFEVIIN